MDLLDTVNPGKPRAAEATLPRCLEHQLLVKGTVCLPKKHHRCIPIICLFDTGAGGRLYVSMKLWCSLRECGPVHAKHCIRDWGLLQAANHADSDIPPIRVCGSATTPLVFHAGNRVQNGTSRAVGKLQHGLVIGPSFSRAHQSIFEFGPGEGLKLEPSAS